MFQIIRPKTLVYLVLSTVSIQAPVMASLKATPDNGMWIEGFVSKKTKEDKGNTPGYALLTGGTVIGLEWPLCPQTQKWQVGLALRYDNSNLDGHWIADLHSPDLNFDSKRGILYTHLAFNNPFYLTGMLSYAFNQYFVYQNLSEPLSFLWGDYDAKHWSGQIEAGYQWSRCDLTLRPTVSLYYSHLNKDEYKQITADNLNNQVIQVIPRRIDNAFFLGGDVNLSYTHHYPKAKVIPYVHAKVNYQTIQDSLQSFIATQAFGEGSAYIYSTSPPKRTRYQIGGGIEVLGDHAVDIIMSYDYSFKPGEYTHALLLSIKHDW